MRLNNQIAIVTGGARGIGLAIAEKLCAAGAHCVLADIDDAGATNAAATLRQAGGKASAVTLNVADPASVTQMVSRVQAQHGRIDALINNAGIGVCTPFLETSLEDWNRVMSVNLTGAFLVAQAVAKVMLAQGGGRIVNITSISGQRGGSGRAAYGAAKAGLELLTKVMAVELAGHGINVNAIAPGAIETELSAIFHDPATRAAYGYLIPQGRYGTPADVANAALFLCADDSRYLQGHTINVDGGFGAAGLILAPPPRDQS